MSIITNSLTLEKKIEQCKDKLDNFYKDRFIAVAKLIVKLTTIKVKYSGQDTISKMQDLILMQEYYSIRLGKLENLEEEISLYHKRITVNNGKLDELHTTLVASRIDGIVEEVNLVLNEINEMIDKCISYTTK